MVPRSSLLVALLAIALMAPGAAAVKLFTYEGHLEAPVLLPDFFGCRYKSACQDQEGQGYVDIDVTPHEALRDPSKPVRWNLYDTGDYLSGRVTVWRVCQYDAYDTPLNCQDAEASAGVGILSVQAKSVRIMLLQGVDRPFEFVLFQ